MQGRLAARHAFGIERGDFQDLLPYTIKTIPEVAMVGKTEDELNEEGVPSRWARLGTGRRRAA